MMAIKKVPYELLLDLTKFLSKRDSLIAEIIYFGAPSVKGVIELKIHDLNFEKRYINFLEDKIKFPEQMFQKIENFIKLKFESKSNLLFENIRGDLVSRIHLDQAFARASANLGEGFKITPASLLKFKMTMHLSPTCLKMPE